MNILNLRKILFYFYFIKAKNQAIKNPASAGFFIKFEIEYNFVSQSTQLNVIAFLTSRYGLLQYQIIVDVTYHG
ncbi:hypothetical protein D3C75_1318600 [compost metagenome]